MAVLHLQVAGKIMAAEIALQRADLLVAALVFRRAFPPSLV